MPFWSYFLIAAALCVALDRLLGAAYILTGFALMFLAFGVAGIFGLNLSDYDALVELLAVLIFTPIFVRLYFVLQGQRTTESTGAPKGVPPPAAGTDRNAKAAYEALKVVGTTLPRFVFHFITGGLVLAAIATLVGLLKPDGSLMMLAFAGSPFVAKYVTEARGMEGTRKYVVIGLVIFCCLMLAAFITFAAAMREFHRA